MEPTLLEQKTFESVSKNTFPSRLKGQVEKGQALSPLSKGRPRGSEVSDPIENPPGSPEKGQ